MVQVTSKHFCIERRDTGRFMNCGKAATWTLTGGAAGTPVETRKYLGLLQVRGGVDLHASVRSQLSAPLG